MNTTQSLFELQAKLAVTIARCNQYARQPHMVRNCISDQEHETEAWNERKRLEAQINKLTEQR